MKSLFPKQEWTDFALEEVKENKLDQMAPADALEFGIDGTPESWVHLLTAMAKHESDFKPTLWRSWQPRNRGLRAAREMVPRGVPMRASRK